VDVSLATSDDSDWCRFADPANSYCPQPMRVVERLFEALMARLDDLEAPPALPCGVCPRPSPDYIHSIPHWP